VYDIIIPSCKPYPELRQRVALIRELDSEKFNYIPTGFSTNAAINRNYGLHIAMTTSDNPFIIMIDDDIGGFFTGWQDAIASPLKEFSSVRISSARLMNSDDTPSPMMGVNLDFSKDIVEVPKFMGVEGYKFPAILSAAIAFRKEDIREGKIQFDNNFIGSGWEDTYFCFKMYRAFEGQCRFVCTNKCRLIHYHEMKSQNEHFEYNKQLFLSLVKMEVGKK